MAFTTREANIPAVQKLLDLDLLSLLRNNQGPTGFKRREFLEVLHESEVDDHDINLQIMFLEDQRRRLGDYGAYLKSLLAPIRRLPDEILVEIFKYCGRMTALQESGSKMYGPLIDGVCASWRRIFHATPCLWSNYLVEHHPDPTGSVASMARALLNRAKDVPLDIEIVMSRVSDSNLLSLFCDLSSRWRTLKVIITTNTIPEVFLGAARGNLPLLEHVNFQAVNAPSLNAGSLFTRAPRLESLCIPLSTASASVFPLHRFTCLNLRMWSDEDYSILHRSINVRELIVVPCRGPLPSRTDITTLAYLKYLVVHAEDFPSKSTPLLFLDHLSCPALTEIVLQGPADGLLSARSPLWSFIERSRCTLLSVKLGIIELDHSLLMRCVALLPSLTTFGVAELMPPVSPSPAFNHRVLECLQTRSVLPALQHLELVLRCEQVPDEDIVDLVSRRSQNGLKSFILHVLGRSFSSEKLRPLKHLGRAGIRISISADHCETFCSCLHLWEHGSGRERVA